MKVNPSTFISIYVCLPNQEKIFPAAFVNLAKYRKFLDMHQALGRGY